MSRMHFHCMCNAVVLTMNIGLWRQREIKFVIFSCDTPDNYVSFFSLGELGFQIIQDLHTALWCPALEVPLMSKSQNDLIMNALLCSDVCSSCCNCCSSSSLSEVFGMIGLCPLF